MATIGDKKVSLALQDGSSINLNKPKVLPASITKIADIKEPGWYIGGTVAGTAPQSLEDESKPVATTVDSDNGIAAQSNESDSIFKLYDDSEINYVITDAPFENLLTSKIFILYVYPIISKSTGSNAVDGNDPDISGFGYLLMTRYGNLHIGTRTTNAEVITWDQIATRHDINHIIEYFQQYYIIDNLTSTDTDKALSANQGKVLKDIVDGLNNEYGTKIKIGDDFNKIWKKGFYYTEGHTKGEILHAPETVIPSFDDGWNSGMLFYVHPSIVNDAYDDSGDGNATKMLVIAHQYLLSYERANTSEHLLQYAAYASRTIRVIVNIADGSVSEYQGCNSEQDWRVMVADNLTTNDSSTALSAAQGKVLNDKVETKMNTPIYSSTDLTPGVSDLADGQIYIVYYN